MNLLLQFQNTEVGDYITLQKEIYSNLSRSLYYIKIQQEQATQATLLDSLNKTSQEGFHTYGSPSLSVYHFEDDRLNSCIVQYLII